MISMSRESIIAGELKGVGADRRCSGAMFAKSFCELECLQKREFAADAGTRGPPVAGRSRLGSSAGPQASKGVVARGSWLAASQGTMGLRERSARAGCANGRGLVAAVADVAGSTVLPDEAPDLGPVEARPSSASAELLPCQIS